MFANYESHSISSIYDLGPRKTLRASSPPALRAPVPVAVPVSVKAPEPLKAPEPPAPPKVKKTKEPKEAPEPTPAPRLQVIKDIVESPPEKQGPKRTTVKSVLWAEARAKGIANYNRLKKSELESALKNHNDS